VLLFCWLLFFAFRRFQCHACKKLESVSIFFLRVNELSRCMSFRRGHQCQGLQPAVAMADYDEFGAPMPAKKGTLLLTAGIAGIGGALLG
jgi:hypothetical protein